MGRGRSRNAHGARVLMHLDERRRDAAVSIALGRLFEACGCDVTFSTRRTTAHLLREGRFDAALLPFVLPYVEYDSLPALSQRTLLYLFPTEGAGFGEWPLMIKFAGGEDPARWDRYIQATKRMFLWGAYSHQVLKATGRFRDEQLVVVGAPRMDLFLVEPSAAERALCDPGVMACASNFTMLNAYTRPNIFETVEGGRFGHGRFFASNRQIEDWFWMEAAQMRVWLEYLDACRHRGERLLLRIHPREDLEPYRALARRYSGTVQLEGQQDLPFEAWLERIGILVGFNSTTLFEAVALSKPAIDLSGLIGPRLADHEADLVMRRYPIMDYVIKPRSWDELFETVHQIRRGGWSGGYAPQARALLEEVCAYPRSTATLAAVVRTVVQDLEGRVWHQGAFDRVLDGLTTINARAIEFATFQLRRDRVTSAWFPLRCRRLERLLAAQIHRYIEAARRFPGSAAVSTEAPGVAAPSGVQDTAAVALARAGSLSSASGAEGGSTS